MIDDGTIKINNPRCEWYLEKIENNQPFAFIKRTHGIWDHLSLLECGALKSDNYKLVDQMIYKKKMETTSYVQAERDDYLKYLNEIRNFILDPPNNNNYYSAISLNLDYVTKKIYKPYFKYKVRVDLRLPFYWKTKYDYTLIFNNLNLWSRNWNYAHMPTYGIITKEILRLPLLCRKFHVVLLAPKKMASLDKRWGLEEKHYSFIAAPEWPDKRPKGNIFSDKVLPALQTYRLRHEYLIKLKNIKSTKRKIYLFEAGTASQWWIDNLFQEDKESTYLDLGRALELWFPDTEWPLKEFVKVHFKNASKEYYGDKIYNEYVKHRNIKL